MTQGKKSSDRSPPPKSESGTQLAESVAASSVRREYARFAVDLEVNLGSEHNFYAGLAQNLSAGGVFVATHRMQKVGSKIDLTLRLPDSPETFTIVGEVRWVRVYNVQSDSPPGLGIQFDALTPEATAAINRFLGQREPLFFDDD